MQPAALATSVEQLLICRLKLDALVKEGAWERAARAGDLALALADAPESGLAKCWSSPSGLGELCLVLRSLVRLGMGAGSGHADAEQEQGRSGERLRPLLARVLHSRHASKSTLGEAAAALKQACGHDFDEWCKHALPGQVDCPALGLLHAAVGVVDAAGALTVAAMPTTREAVRDGLARRTEERASALTLVRDLVVASPHGLASLLPVLQTAVYLEEPPVRHLALAAMLDATFALADSPADGAPEAARLQLADAIAWLPTLLHAPSVELQAIAALGLAKLPLHCSVPGRLLPSLQDEPATPEGLVAALAYRYTTIEDAVAEPPAGATGRGKGRARGSNAGARSTSKAEKAWPVLPALQAFFERMSGGDNEAEEKARQSVLANTIAWVLLDDLCSGADAASPVVEPSLRARRCARFLAAHLKEATTLDKVVQLVRLELEHDVAPHALPSSVVIRQWLSSA